jgi:hypothetical protein
MTTVATAMGTFTGLVVGGSLCTALCVGSIRLVTQVIRRRPATTPPTHRKQGRRRA